MKVDGNRWQVDESRWQRDVKRWKRSEKEMAEICGRRSFQPPWGGKGRVLNTSESFPYDMVNEPA